MNSFFWTGSLMKIPHPATSDGASSRCCDQNHRLGSDYSLKRFCRTGPHLLGAALDGAVLAGHVLAVPVVGGAAGQAQVRVAFPHRQVTGALLGVALGFAPATREAVLTCGDGTPAQNPARQNGARQNGACAYTRSCTGRTSRRSSAR